MLTEDEKRGLKTPLCRTPVSELLQFAAQFLPTSKSSYLPNNQDSSHLADFVHFHHATTESMVPYCPAYTMGIPESNMPVESDPGINASLSDQPVMQSCVAVESVDNASSIPLAYPPMPASAHHVSVVQERILRGSSAADVTETPSIQSDVCRSPPAEPKSPVNFETSNVGQRQQAMSSVSGSDSTSSSSSRGRHTTPRRSRVVARFGVIPNYDATPATRV